jgi:hypothetical protein
MNSEKTNNSNLTEEKNTSSSGSKKNLSNLSDFDAFTFA